MANKSSPGEISGEDRNLEIWGRGIQKICDSCEALGAEKPEYIISGSDIMVVFKALQSAALKDSNVPTGSLDGSLENRLLELLKQNPKIKAADAARSLDIGERSCYRLLEKLKDKGIIERLGGKSIPVQHGITHGGDMYCGGQSTCSQAGREREDR